MDISKKAKQYLPVVILVFVTVLAPLFIRGAYLSSVMSMIGIYAILAIGMCLIIGYAGQFSLAHPAFFGIGAYVTAILVKNYSWPPITAFVIAGVVTGIVAYCIGRPLFRLRGYYFAAATFCVLIVIQNCMDEFRDITGGAQGIHGIPPFHIGGLVFDGYLSNYYLIWFVVIVSTLLSFNLVNSKVGRAMRAISTSEMAAQSCGVHIAKYKVYIFIYSAITASITGSLYAHYISFIGPETFGFGILLDLLLMIVIGGIDTIWGGLIGAIIFVLLGETISDLLTSQTYLSFGGESIMIIWGIIVVIMMNFMPKGMVTIGVEKVTFLVAKLKTTNAE
jgi:branched-chain amino acid transport system permease protein